MDAATAHPMLNFAFIANSPVGQAKAHYARLHGVKRGRAGSGVEISQKIAI
jgi:hypothetical protein